MKTKRILSLSMLGILSIASLAGCSDNLEINGIKIVESSIGTTFTLDEVVDYSNLTINLVNTDGDTYETLKYSENQDVISFEEMDTSQLGTFTFTVTYTHIDNGTSVEYSDSMEYEVVEELPASEITLVSWEINENYLLYETFKSDADLNDNELDSSSNSFISSEGKFYIGNMNSVNLMPRASGLDENLQVSVASSLPKGDVEIYLSDENGSLDVLDYFEEDDLDNLKEYGLVKFKEDLALEDGETKDVTLTFSLPESSGYDNTRFPDLLYEISIVADGYNVTDAKELVLFDNYHDNSSYPSYTRMKEEVLGLAEGALDSDPYFTYSAFIIFNNIEIDFDDLPSDMIYQEDEVESEPSLADSLKDRQFIYQRSASNDDNDSVHVYGNYKTISLGSDFPYVLTEDFPSSNITIDITKSSIDTHTALFGDEIESGVTSKANEYSIKFYDLSVIGNQGVSETQDKEFTFVDGTTLAIPHGGVIFTKSFHDFYYENVNANGFFITHINNAFYTQNNAKLAGYEPTTFYVNRSRLDDNFSSMLFNYSEATMKISESVLTDCGGFLIINQANPYKSTSSAHSSMWDGLNSEGVEVISGSNIYIDETTILENYVTGEGGWFSIYGATSAMSTLKLMISDTLHGYGKTLFADDGTETERMNAIVLTMTTEVASAGALEAGMVAEVKIGDYTYTNYGEGKDEFNEVLVSDEFASGDYSGLISNMISTSYGANFIANYTSALLMVPQENDVPYYISPYTADMQNFSLLSLESLVNSIFGNGSPTTVDTSYLDNDYITVFYNYGVTPSNPDLTAFATDLANYKGESSYALVVGLYDYE